MIQVVNPITVRTLGDMYSLKAKAGQVVAVEATNEYWVLMPGQEPGKVRWAPTGLRVAHTRPVRYLNVKELP